MILFAITLLSLASLLITAPYFTGTDISAWGGDWLKLSNCLDGVHALCSNLSKFPVAYLINSNLLHLLNLQGFSIEKSIFFVNFIFLTLPIYFLIVVRGASFACKAGFVYIITLTFTSLPSFYIFSGALEVQLGVLMGIFVSSVVLLYERISIKNVYGLSVFIFISALFFPMYKDTNFLVISVSLAATYIFIRVFYNIRLNPNIDKNKFDIPNNIEVIKMPFKAGIFSTFCISFLVILSYNYIRYSSFFPVEYLYEASQTSPKLNKSIEFFIATIFSGNGGMLFFWSASLIVCISLIKDFGLKISFSGVFVSMIIILISAIGFSFWWAPFGWDSWGDRLMVPSMLSLIIVLISTADYDFFYKFCLKDQKLQFYSKFIQPYLTWPIIVIFLISFNYTFASYFINKSKLMNISLFGPECVVMVNDLHNNGKALGLPFWRSSSYYSCARERFFNYPRLF